MGSDRYCLRWNNHQNNLLGVFSQLLQEESLVDVTLACSEGHSIRAHKVVLSACSSYFQSLFVDHPNRHPIIILKDVCFAELRTLVEFMYRGEVNLEYCQLPTFLKTAESLQVKGLAEMTPHLPSSLSPDRELLAGGGGSASPDERPATAAAVEPLPLVRRRSADSDPERRPETPGQASPRSTPPAASPQPPRSPSTHSPMSVSPPPPDTCSDDRSMSPDLDDESSNHSGPNDLTTSSQMSSPTRLKVIPGPSNFLPVQNAPLSLKIEPNSDCDIKNEERSSGGNNGSDCSSSRYLQDTDLFERQAVYSCTYCAAAFPHQSKLTRHILSHSLETLKYRETRSQPSAPPAPYVSPFAVAAHHAAAASAVVCAGTLSPVGAIIANAAAHDGVCGNGASGGCVLGEWSPLRAPLVELPQALDAQQSAALEAGGAVEAPGAVCKFCGKAFADVGALIGHLPAHTGDRPFKCEFCGKAFKLRHHMKDHCRVHTGERPFRCSLCGKTFSRSTILKAHEKTHYPKYVRKFLSSPSPEEEHRPPDIPLPCDLSVPENHVEASTSAPPVYVHRPTPSPSP